MICITIQMTKFESYLTLIPDSLLSAQAASRSDSSISRLILSWRKNFIWTSSTIWIMGVSGSAPSLSAANLWRSTRTWSWKSIPPQVFLTCSDLAKCSSERSTCSFRFCSVSNSFRYLNDPLLAVVQRDHVLLWALFCINIPLQWGTLCQFSSQVKAATNVSNTKHWYVSGKWAKS